MLCYWWEGKNTGTYKGEREIEGGGSERGGFMMSGKFLEEFDHKVLQDFREQLLGVLG